MGKIQAPDKVRRGWSGMVADLNAAEDLRSFHAGILDLQSKIVAAEYGALWMRDASGELKMLAGWPPKMEENPRSTPVWELLSEAAKGGFERDASQVLKVEPENSTDAPGIGAHVFVTALRVHGQVAAVTTVVADCRDPAVIQSTVPMRELAAGLYELYFAKEQTRRQVLQNEQMRSSMAILATSQDAPGFTGACLNLVNSLARQLKCTRVSVGWIKGRKIKLKAMSDTEDLKRHSQEVGLIELAMSECLDQQQPILCPPPEDAEPLLAEAILHAHKQLVTSSGNTHILSVPLRMHDQWLGVISLERADEPFDLDLVTQLQMVADVVAPQLYDRWDSDRWLIGHAFKSIERGAGYLVGPKHVAWKLLAIAIVAVLIFIITGTLSYKVSADFVFQIEKKRVVSAPFESDLIAVNVVPGDKVVEGQILAEINAKQLKLERIEAQTQRNLAELQVRQHGAGRELTERDQARARMARAQATIDLLTWKIGQASIRAPITGTLLAGDWRDRVGSIVPQGEPMFEIAPLEDIVVLIRVPEADIDMIQIYVNAQGKLPSGRLATRSQPDQKFEFDVERIIPLSESYNNANVFQVRAHLTAPQSWLHPGMEGLARIDVGIRPVYWIITHRINDMLKLWLWW
jgi:hypothetical protein